MKTEQKNQGRKPYNKNKKQQNKKTTAIQEAPPLKAAQADFNKELELVVAVVKPAKKQSLLKRIWIKIKKAFKWLFSK